ncbi:MAG: hypothetical protein J6Y60_11695 [Treponema sp.]|nr:hypothetical protein [Treponema sp.]
MTMNIFTYLSILLMLLIAVPGRLAYGICILIFLILLFLSGSLFKKLIYKLGIQEFQVVLLSIFLVSMTVLLRQLLVMFCPIIALTMGYAVFMPALSAFLLNNLYEEKSVNTIEFQNTMRQGLLFSGLMIVIFLLRDIIGFGTITLPVYNDLAVIHIFKSVPSGVAAGTALASIPGSFFLIGIAIVISSMIRNRNIKNNMLRKAQDEELENVE